LQQPPIDGRQSQPDQGHAGEMLGQAKAMHYVDDKEGNPA